MKLFRRRADRVPVNDQITVSRPGIGVETGDGFRHGWYPINFIKGWSPRGSIGTLCIRNIRVLNVEKHMPHNLFAWANNGCIAVNLDFVRSFVMVVSLGGVTKAAAARGLSKSTISEHIRALEQALGTKLLLTTTRRISLTPAGRGFYEQSAGSIATLDAAAAQVRQIQSLPTGTLKITVPVDMATTFLAPHLFAFSDLHPDIKLALNLSSDNVNLRDQGFDVALRMGVVEESDLVVRPLATFERHLFASPGYLERAGAPDRPAQLASHRCLVFPTLGDHSNWILTRGRQTVKIDAAGPLSVNSLGFVYEAVINGFGVGMLPQFMSKQAQSQGLIRKVLPEWKVARSILSADSRA